MIVHFYRIVTGHLGGADLALDLITPTSERDQYLSSSRPLPGRARRPWSSAVAPGCPTSTPRRVCAGEPCGGPRSSALINTPIAPDQPARLFDDHRGVWPRLQRGDDRRRPARPAAGRRHRRALGRPAGRRGPAAGSPRSIAARCPRVGQRPGGLLGDAGVHRRRHDRPPAERLGGPSRPTPRNRCRCSRRRSDEHRVAAISREVPRRGAAWEFLVLFLVVIIGPPLLERARLPGIIGLLIGGYVIGPHGLT